MRSIRRGFGSRFTSTVNATRVPYRAAAEPSNGSGSNSTIAAANFSVRAARLAASFAIATPWWSSAIVIAVNSGITGRTVGSSRARSM